MMKKVGGFGQGSQKSVQRTGAKKQPSRIIFQYKNLSCFISSASQRPSKPSNKTNKHQQKIKDRVAEMLASHSLQKPNSLSQLRVPRANRGVVACTNRNDFTNSLLLLDFEKEEEHRAQPKRQSEEKPGSRKDSPKNEEESEQVNQILKSCMRIITQDTEHSSNPISTRYTPVISPSHQHLQTMPANFQAIREQSQPYSSVNMMMPLQDEYYYQNQCSMVRSQSIRNRRIVSQEESREYVIDLRKIELDGRTTIMVRNIPNKYTQEMLLELFEKNHKKKFDFFYLPIDYNNNCNVGYAFLNFISTKFISDFYNDFNNHKWNRFNSVKVCQVCYARIQGTAQLQHHFQQTNVLQQRQRRFRPLIGYDNISTLVFQQQHQQEEHQPQPTNEDRHQA